MSITGRIRWIGDLTAQQRGRMFALMTQYYDHVDLDEFETDLDEKDWVIEVADPATGELLGFSTQMVLTVPQRSGPVRALFSGDTIMDRRVRQRNPLTRLWGRLALSLIDEYAGEDLYWFLISKGYKTYRFLPLFFHEFYPCRDTPTPPRIAERIDALGHFKYPATYDPAAGIVRAGENACRLRSGAADVTSERLRDGHVAFFCARNPRHQLGDELCCLAPLTRANFTNTAWKAIDADPGDPADALSPLPTGVPAGCLS